MFIAFVITLLVLHRDDHEIGVRESLWLSLVKAPRTGGETGPA